LSGIFAGVGERAAFGVVAGVPAAARQVIGITPFEFLRCNADRLGRSAGICSCGNIFREKKRYILFFSLTGRLPRPIFLLSTPPVRLRPF